MSPRVPEPPREHSIWENTVLHEFDMHGSSKAPDGLGRRNKSNSPRRAQSAGYNIHRQGFPRECTQHQGCYRENGHQSCCRNFTASKASSRLRWPSTVCNQGRGGFQEKSPVIRCHHRCKLLNDVQEQKRSRSRFAKAVEEHGDIPIFHQLVPKSVPLPEDKKELVEWNNFVNKMTSTLLNLKGLALSHDYAPACL